MRLSSPATSSFSPAQAGALNPVVAEIRQVLARVAASLANPALDESGLSEASALAPALQSLQQVDGILRLLGEPGSSLVMARLLGSLEEVLQRPAVMTPARRAAMLLACQEIPDYLDALLSSSAPTALQLFPAYEALLQAGGQKQVSPAPLLFPASPAEAAGVNADVAPDATCAATSFSATELQATMAALRQRFEARLLPAMQGRAESQDLAGLAHCLQMGARLASAPVSADFWQVAALLGEALKAGQIPLDLALKQWLAGCNRYLRRLESTSAMPPWPGLLQEGLLLLATLPTPSSAVQALLAAHRLHAPLPRDFRPATARTLDDATLAQMQAFIQEAKARWQHLVETPGQDAAALPSVRLPLSEAEMQHSLPALQPLLVALVQQMEVASLQAPSSALATEVATSLLFAEQMLAQPRQWPSDLDVHVARHCQRLRQAEIGVLDRAAQQDGFAHAWQHAQAREALVQQMQASLCQAEKLLESYLGATMPASTLALEQARQLMQHLQAVLALMAAPEAVQALQHLCATLDKMVVTNAATEESETDVLPEDRAEPGVSVVSLLEPALVDNLVRNMGALSFLLDEMVVTGELGASSHVFDTDNALLSRRAPQQDEERAAPDLEDTVPAELPPTAAEALMQETAPQSAEVADLSLPVTIEAALEQESDVQDAVEQETVQQEAAQQEAAQQEVTQQEIVVTSSTLSAAYEIEPPTAEEDAELRNIFLGEAMEMLACIDATLPLCRQQPQHEHVVTLRRCFHTIKGSGRMVGLIELAEVAWEAEQQLNQVLAEKSAGNSALFSRVQQAWARLHPWVARLQQEATLQPVPAASEEAATTQPVSDLAQPITAEADVVTTLASEQPEAVWPDTQADAQKDAAAMPETRASEMPLAMPADVVDQAAGVQPALPALPPPSKDIQIGPLRLTVALHAIFLAEAQQLAQVLSEEVRAWKNSGQRSPGLLAAHAAHSLAGSSATVGFEPLRMLGNRLEQVLHWLLRRPVALQPLEIETLSQSVAAIHTMLAQWQRLEPALPAMQQLHALQALQARLQRRDQAVLSTALILPPAKPLAATSVLPPTKEMLPAASDMASDAAAEVAAQPDTLSPAPVGAVLEVEAEADLPPTFVTDWIDPPALPIGQSEQAETAGPLLVEPLALASDSAAEPAEMVADLQALSALPDSLFEHDVALAQALAPRDELDPDLLPVFLEEGNELLPALEEGLRHWLAHPAEIKRAAGLLRHLHTLKGSARMAGAMQLGQQLHQLESRIEQINRLGNAAPALLEDLLERFDDSCQLFDRLQPQAAVAQPVAAPPDAPSLPRSATAAPAAANQQAPAAALLVRVRADLLEGLANQAGEIAIARSRVEDRVEALHGALHDMNENVLRLQHQLREMEIQAEARIAAQQWQGSEREFDPLEFDRFTRLQELTRMMAESVNDVSSVQQSLARTTEQAQLDLAAQARLNRSLQEDLLRMRMVPFGSITERLYRVCRQVAKEMGKRVNLDIQGAEVEVDRQVLERMGGPLEHLLRNAVVHGIEAEDARRAAGKPGAGQLTVQVRREGRQVVITCSDDGQGLDMARIRHKAENLGLVANGAVVAPELQQQWIFEPGFSTASQVTELAGRGIGMDVVRAEAEHLGGQVSLASTAGQGTQFDIRLPLTLAVSQVVLVKAGARTYALPAAAIEHVQQLKPAALAAAHQRGRIDWREQTPALVYLPLLLGENAAAPQPQLATPVVIVRTAQGLLALHVDQVLGNREVVLKPAGPHLARVAGVAGATVLGSGEIVLILEPAAMQAVVQAASPLAPVAVAPVLSSQPLVMVVDDSLTVRRVTQRLLLRAGYQVLLAKDGLDALEQMQSVTPDVMLLDIEMPRMDGFELTRHLRGNASTQALPIIMITSRTAAKHRRYAETLGVNAYLGKPYQDMALLEQVATCLQQVQPQPGLQEEALVPGA